MVIEIVEKKRRYKGEKGREREGDRGGRGDHRLKVTRIIAIATATTSNRRLPSAHFWGTMIVIASSTIPGL